VLEINDLSTLLRATGNADIDNHNVETLQKLKQMYKDNPNLKNDEAKYLLPEAFLTRLYCKFNIRSFRNFLHLRADEHAHPEIRELACLMIKKLRGSLYETLIEDIITRVDSQGNGEMIGSVLGKTV